MPIWSFLWSFGNFVVLWYILPVFGILIQEKNGNPANSQFVKDIAQNVPSPSRILSK
jgi:hypothetical protein